MKRWIRLALFAWLACSATAAAPAGAQPAQTAGAQPTREDYALVVGSNLGGPGQAPLRYAEEDANRVADVLTALGGYPDQHVERLLQPSAAELRAAIERIRVRVLPLAGSGVQWRFFFYYSGHARADALNLGPEQLPLAELRERLLGLPATLSVVVLDACQSGAFSRVKGAGRAADFSFNSVDRLNTAGIAVIASSSAQELSQESDELRSSFFTHHWLVALRGGGDRDADGRVTLSEAYQYTYNHTLATTAQTAVGEQHATLETSFKGQDDVPLTQPAAANAHLRIPTLFEGRVLVQSLPSWSVLAELDKARGEPIRLALPAGHYAASVRQGSGVSRCMLVLRDGAETMLYPNQCAHVALASTLVKGTLTAADRAPAIGPGDEGWVLELGAGFGGGHDQDAYIQRLHDFDFSRNSGALDGARFTLSLGRRVHPNLLLGLSYFNLQALSYQRDFELKQSFSLNAHALGPFVQGDLPFGRRRILSFYGRLGIGVSVAWTSFDAVVPSAPFPDQQPALQDTTARTKQMGQSFVRPCGWISAGVQLMPWRYIGFQFELRYVVAPAIENEFGETHDLGGFAWTTGIRLRTWE
jgi:hypothetical protein